MLNVSYTSTRYTVDRLEAVLEALWSVHYDGWGIMDEYNSFSMPRPSIFKFIQHEDFES